MRTRHLLRCGGAWLALAVGLCAAQQPQQPQTDLPEELRIAPPMDPMPALEVVTVRKTDGKPVKGLLVTTMKPYLMSAFSLNMQQDSRVIGAPSWLVSQPWVINGKPSDELRVALQTMPRDKAALVNQMLRRSVLIDQFKMKSHIEQRQMPYYELVAAKGGIKLKEVPAATPPAPGGPLPAPPAPGAPPPPGVMFGSNKNGTMVINARAATMRMLMSMVMGTPDVGGRPIVDKTGFKGSFDLVDIPMATLVAGPDGRMSVSPDSPSIFTTLEESLGLKLVPTKGPVEVVVIDSMEEPTEN